MSKQPIVVAHLVRQERELGAEPLQCSFAHLRRIRRREERPEALVDFGRDEVQHLLQTVTIHRPRRRGELRLRLQIREVLQEHRDLGEHRSVRESERRDRAFRIDLPVVGPFGRRLGLHVDLVDRDIEAKLTKCDVRRARTGARREVEGHHDRLIYRASQRCAMYASKSSFERADLLVMVRTFP